MGGGGSSVAEAKTEKTFLGQKCNSHFYFYCHPQYSNQLLYLSLSVSFLQSLYISLYHLTFFLLWLLLFKPKDVTFQELVCQKFTFECSKHFEIILRFKNSFETHGHLQERKSFKIRFINVTPD